MVLLVACLCQVEMIVVLLEESVLQIVVFGHYRDGTCHRHPFLWKCLSSGSSSIGSFLSGDIEVANIGQSFDMINNMFSLWCTKNC